MKPIYSTLAIAMLAFAACDDDSYNDWQQPQANAETPADQMIATNFTVEAAGAVNFANLDEKVDTLVTVFTPSLTTKGQQADDVKYNVILGNSTSEVQATPDGKIRTADLRSAIEAEFGKAPYERELAAKVVVYTKFGSIVSREAANVTVVATLSAPEIEEAYYYIGTANGWAKEPVYKFTRKDESVSVFDDPIFTCTVPASFDAETGERAEEWFKIATASAYALDNVWDGKILGAATNGDESLVANLVNEDPQAFKQPATDGALMYEITLNMMEYTITIKPISFTEWIYTPGNAQGWDPETAPAMRSAAQDGKYVGFAYLDGGFKFTKERKWGAEYNKNDFKEFPEGFAGAESADDSNIECSAPGVYSLNLDLTTGSFGATLIESIGLVGPAQAGGWDEDSDMTFDKENGVYTWTGDLKADEIKFRANDKWDINLGGSFDNLTLGGDNINIEEAGNYTITLHPFITSGDKIFATVVKN